MHCKVWILTALVTGVMNTVKVQIAIPMYPPLFPPPAPIYPMPIPIIAQIHNNAAATTTTKRPHNIAVVMPMPVPVGIPMPAVMGPPPILMVPFPPPLPTLKKKIYSSCSKDSSESSSSDSDYVRRRRRFRRYRRRRRRYGGFRRYRRSSGGENELVNPILSYISDNGDVKFKAKISEDDAAKLLGKKDNKHQPVQVTTGEDEKNRPKLGVLSKSGGKQKREQYKKGLLRGGISDHVLSDGKKELNFRPPGNKKISNLSVSFQIS